MQIKRIERIGERIGRAKSLNLIFRKFRADHYQGSPPMWKLGEKYRIFIGLAGDRTQDLCEHVHGLSVQTTTPLAP